MDFSAIISAITDKGWRVGLPVAIAAAAILWTHHAQWTEPDVLKPWLGTAITAGALGTAVTLVAIVSSVLGGIRDAMRNASYEAERRQQQERQVAQFRSEFYSRLDALQGFQQARLLELIRTEANLFFS